MGMACAQRLAGFVLRLGIAMSQSRWCRNCLGCGGALLWLSATGGFCSALGEADTLTRENMDGLNMRQADEAVEGYAVWSKMPVMCSSRLYCIYLSWCTLSETNPLVILHSRKRSCGQVDCTWKEWSAYPFSNHTGNIFAYSGTHVLFKKTPAPSNDNQTGCSQAKGQPRRLRRFPQRQHWRFSSNRKVTSFHRHGHDDITIS
jgi:hypothetical protein